MILIQLYVFSSAYFVLISSSLGDIIPSIHLIDRFLSFFFQFIDHESEARGARDPNVQ